MTLLTAFVLLCLSVALHLSKHLTLLVIEHRKQSRLANIEDWIDWDGNRHAMRRHSYASGRGGWFGFGGKA